MISSVSGGSALALLSVFGRSSGGQAAAETTAKRPPPPPPPPSEGNGASAQSVFEALLKGENSSAVDGLLGDLVSGLDADGDASLSSVDLETALTQTASTGTGDLSELVSNILAKLDTDADSALSAEELTSGLQEIAEKGSPPAASASGASGGSATDKASHLIGALDTDGDGTLSAKELAAAFTVDTPSPVSGTQKSVQEMLFDLLLERNDQERTLQAMSLYAA